MIGVKGEGAAEDGPGMRDSAVHYALCLGLCGGLAGGDGSSISFRNRAKCVDVLSDGHRDARVLDRDRADAGSRVSGFGGGRGLPGAPDRLETVRRAGWAGYGSPSAPCYAGGLVGNNASGESARNIRTLSHAGVTEGNYAQGSASSSLNDLDAAGLSCSSSSVAPGLSAFMAASS